jgi:hypothetical protein
MRDSDIVRKLLQLDEYRQKIDDIIDEIKHSEHPNAYEISEALYEQCWFPAWPEHVAFDYLDKNRWALRELPGGTHGGIISRRKAKYHKIKTVD